MKTTKLILLLTIFTLLSCDTMFDINGVKSTVIEASVQQYIESKYPGGIVYEDSTKNISIVLTFKVVDIETGKVILTDTGHDMFEVYSLEFPLPMNNDEMTTTIADMIENDILKDALAVVHVYIRGYDE